MARGACSGLELSRSSCWEEQAESTYPVQCLASSCKEKGCLPGHALSEGVVRDRRDRSAWLLAVLWFRLTKEQQASRPAVSLQAGKLLAHVQGSEGASEKYFERWF